MCKYFTMGILALTLAGCSAHLESDIEFEQIFVEQTEICQVNNQICPGPKYDVTGETGTCDQQMVCIVCDGHNVNDKLGEDLKGCKDFFCRLDSEMYATVHEEMDTVGTCFTEDNKLGTCNNKGICMPSTEGK